MNIQKTRFDFDAQPGKTVKGASLTVVMTVEVEYFDKEDKVKYLQYATLEVVDAFMRSPGAIPTLVDSFEQIQNELIRRYNGSSVFRFLELPATADRMSQQQLKERLTRIVTDYNDGKF